jgi:hypothetical protein
MKTHHQAALDGLKNARRDFNMNDRPSALAAIGAEATLAVADEQARTNAHLETANLIAYAQLRRDRRRPSLATEELVDRRMSVFAEIRDELAEDKEDL